jgi:glycosyltransferase involved in cell wall biosynthesis
MFLKNGKDSKLVISILTRNSEKTLEAALQSVHQCGSVLVLDGGSVDTTQDIARRYGAQVISQPQQCLDMDGRILDYSCVRNYALEYLSAPWHAYIDSDELWTQELRDEVLEIVDGEPCAVWVDRKYVFDGVVIEHACTYPAQQMRLFHTSCVSSFIKPIHERVVLLQDARVRRTRASMLVPLPSDISELTNRWSRYLHSELGRRPQLALHVGIAQIFREFAIACLYMTRIIRNFFREGTKLPLKFELARVKYQISLCVGLAKKIHFW